MYLRRVLRCAKNRKQRVATKTSASSPYYFASEIIARNRVERLIATSHRSARIRDVEFNSTNYILFARSDNAKRCKNNREKFEELMGVAKCMEKEDLPRQRFVNIRTALNICVSHFFYCSSKNVLLSVY